MPNVTLALRKRQDNWVGAVIADSKLQDAFVEDALVPSDMMMMHLGPFIDAIKQGRITVEVTVDQ